jgi:hypothetical protein
MQLILGGTGDKREGEPLTKARSKPIFPAALTFDPNSEAGWPRKT